MQEKEKDFYISLGENIAAARKRRGLKQKFLSEEMSKGADWISRVEAGKVPVKAFQLYQIAALLGVAPGKFFKVEENVGV